MEFSGFVEWAFLGLVGGGVYILWQMKESLANLNTRLEVVIIEQKLTTAQTNLQLNDHETRLRNLEAQ